MPDSGDNFQTITVKLQADTKQYINSITAAMNITKKISTSTAGGTLNADLVKLRTGYEDFLKVISSSSTTPAMFSKAQQSLVPLQDNLREVTSLMRDAQRVLSGQGSRAEKENFFQNFGNPTVVKNVGELEKQIAALQNEIKKPIKDTTVSGVAQAAVDAKQKVRDLQAEINNIYDGRTGKFNTNKSNNAIFDAQSGARKSLEDTLQARKELFDKNNWAMSDRGKYYNSTDAKATVGDPNYANLSFKELEDLRQRLNAQSKAVEESTQADKNYKDAVDQATKTHEANIANARHNVEVAANTAGVNLGNTSALDDKGVARIATDAALNLKEAQINNVTQAMQGMNVVEKNLTKDSNTFNTSLRDTNAAMETLVNKEQGVSQLTQRFAYFFTIGNAIRMVTRAIRSAYQAITDLDKSMTETAVVTKFSINDLWEQVPKYTQTANELGVTTKGVYETMTLFYQQGLNTTEAFELGTETLKMARIAGLDYATATKYMTNALRGFNMELTETSAQNVNDVYSKLAAISAADTEQIAVAMSKVASLANNAGMSLETTASFLTQIVETTQESAETAGTALKTVIARFTELKKSPSEIGEVDGEIVDANKIETALRSVDIALRDSTGQFRDLDDVFVDLAKKWDSLDTNTQRYIATVAAGSRQQSRFIAMMSNYKRTIDLIDAANTAAGASNEQFGKTLESLESKTNKLTNAWNEFTMGITNSEVIKTAIDLLTGFLNVINKLTSTGGQLTQTMGKMLLAVGAFKLGGAAVGAFQQSIKSPDPLERRAIFGSTFSARLTPQYKLQLQQADRYGEWAKDTSRLEENMGTTAYNRFNSAYEKYKESHKGVTVSQKDYLEILEKETRSTAEFAQKLSGVAIGATALAAGLGALGNRLTKVGEETGNLSKKKWGDAITGLSTGLSILSAGLLLATKLATSFGKAVGATATGVTVIIAGLVALVKIVDAVTISASESAAASKEFSDSLSDVIDNYNTLASNIDNYAALINGLDKLIKGSNEYNDTLKESIALSTQLKEENKWFVDKYQNGKNDYFDEYGHLTEVGAKALKEEGQQRAIAQQAAATVVISDTTRQAERNTHYFSNSYALSEGRITGYDAIDKVWKESGPEGLQGELENIISRYGGFDNYNESLRKYAQLYLDQISEISALAQNLAGFYATQYEDNLSGVFVSKYQEQQYKKQVADITSQNLSNKNLRKLIYETGSINKDSDLGKQIEGQTGADLVNKLAAIQAANIAQIDISNLPSEVQELLTGDFSRNTIDTVFTQPLEDVRNYFNNELQNANYDIDSSTLDKLIGDALASWLGLNLSGSGQNLLIEYSDDIEELTKQLNKAIEGTEIDQLYQSLKAENEELEISDTLWKAHAIDVDAAQASYATFGKTLNDNLEKLDNYNVNSVESRKALTEVTQSMRQAFGNNEIQESWVLENLSLLKEWINGSKTAALQIQKNLRKAALETYGDIENPELLNNLITKTFEAMEQAGADGSFKLGDVIREGLEAGLNASSLMKTLEAVGIQLTAEQQGLIEQWQAQIDRGTSANFGEIIGTNAFATMAGAIDFGGDNGKTQSPWLNSLDRLYNLNEQINEQLRQRELLEKKYNRQLKDSVVSVKALQATSMGEILNLYQQRDLKAVFAAERQKDIDNLANTRYITEDDAISTWGRLGVTKYARYNKETNDVVIDWTAINKITDNELGTQTLEYVNKLQELADEMEKTNDELLDIEDEIREIRERNKQDWLDFEQTVYDAIVADKQRQIDEYSAYNEKLNDTNSRILDALKQQIDLERQIRDNTKKEEDIADKENRLAYLQRDTSGANSQEILQLQEELEESRQSYTDTLVDQALTRLQEENDQAALQREEQIDIMSAQLDWLSQNGAYWQRASELIEGAINKDGTLNNNSSLVELLKQDGNFKAMSEFNQVKFLEDMGVQFAKALEGNAQWMVSKAEAMGTVAAENIANWTGGDLTYDKTKKQWMYNGKAYELGYDVTSKQYTANAIQSITPRVPAIQTGSTTRNGGNTSSGSTTTDTTATTATADSEYTKILKELGIENLPRVDQIAELQRYSNTLSTGGYARLHPEINVIERKKIVDELIQWLLKTPLTPALGGGGSSKSYVDLKAFASGGLANFTGPAWLDGSKTNPEVVLNAVDSKNFIELRDVLRNFNSSLGTSIGGDTYYDINIEASLNSDYSVDQVANRIKEIIYHDSQYRNNNLLALSH